MVNKVAQYLQEHLGGEVTSALEVRRYFSTDASILSLTPSLVAYPMDENDVRKVARFSWQLAERGQVLPITARGGGTDTSGAAIGSGVMLVFKRHLNRLVAFDPRKQLAVVEPGITFDQLERVARSYNLTLPAHPRSATVATVGGGIAKNGLGPKSVKYGALADYVESLRVVLANGEVIEVRPLSRRELSHKLGLPTFEGDIYRALDTLLEENAELIKTGAPNLKARHNAAGYNLFDLKTAGHFDLTPLFIGSQGSLGLITEATLRLDALSPSSTLALISLGSLEDLQEILPKILNLSPSVLEMINRQAIDQATRLNPARLKGALTHPAAAVQLFVEFDNFKESDQKRLLKSLQRLVEKVDGQFHLAKNEDESLQINKVRHSGSTVLRGDDSLSRAVPVAEDIAVPPEKVVEFMRQAIELYGPMGLEPAMWGDLGSGVIRMRPLLNLAEIGDRQRLFKIIDNLYQLAIDLGGSPTAATGDGRVRPTHARKLYGEQLHDLMLQVKKIFDPRGILNPGVKTATLDEMKALIREDYSLGYHEHHLSI